MRIAGYPSAVFAALRGSNQGRPTILATSDDASDDLLAREARRHGLTIFRGPLRDVLARYFLAAANLPDDCTVVRLTGDNVVPDGAFVEELAREFMSGDAEYVGTDLLLSHMPYGLSGEAFSVAALRRAHAAALSPSDREHVGPWIRRNCRSGVFIPKAGENEDFSHLRCTIDDEEDYERVLLLFDGVADPLQVSWTDLARKLATLPGEPAFRVPCRVVSGLAHSEFTLGTAQLGMRYGVVNDSGKPSRSEAISIVRRAVAHGVTALDTARTYEDAEAVLGDALVGAWGSRANVITKLDLSGLPTWTSEADVRSRVDESVNCSSRALRSTKLATLLLHRWDHHHLWNGAAWRRLLELKEDGRIAVLGASVYETSEALEALQDPAIHHLQIPVNVLDQRWKTAGVDRAIAHRPEITVHARSALLQGILAHPSTRWPLVGDFDRANCGKRLSIFSHKFGRDSVADLCLAYVRSLSWITSIVVGCDSMHQLEQNLRFFLRPKLSPSQCEELEKAIPTVPEVFLNPAKWDTAREPTAVYAR